MDKTTLTRLAAPGTLSRTGERGDPAYRGWVGKGTVTSVVR